MEVPPPKFFRLRPGAEVRLKSAYIIRCDEVVKDAAGNVVELKCTADLGSKTGGPTAARKVKGVLHWVSARHAVDLEARLYDRLFTVPEPDAKGDFKSHLNPHSLEVITVKGEPSLQDAAVGSRFQFERLAYFCVDKDSTPGRLVFNRTIDLAVVAPVVERQVMDSPEEPPSRLQHRAILGMKFHKRFLNHIFGRCQAAGQAHGAAQQRRFQS